MKRSILTLTLLGLALCVPASVQTNATPLSVTGAAVAADDGVIVLVQRRGGAAVRRSTTVRRGAAVGRGGATVRRSTTVRRGAVVGRGGAVVRRGAVVGRGGVAVRRGVVVRRGAWVAIRMKLSKKRGPSNHQWPKSSASNGLTMIESKFSSLSSRKRKRHFSKKSRACSSAAASAQLRS